MNDNTPNVSEIIRAIADDTDSPSVSLSRSMRAVAELASRVVSTIEKTDFILTGDQENDLVLGYEVARRLGVERAVLHHDEGILSLDGAQITNHSVTFLSVLPSNPERTEALRLIVERAGSSLDNVISALNASDLKELPDFGSRA